MCPRNENAVLSEIEVINYIKYTLEHYSGDINDLEWSTSQIQSVLSSLEKAERKAIIWQKEAEAQREKVKKLEILLSEAGK